MKKILAVLFLLAVLPSVALAHDYHWRNSGSGWHSPSDKVLGGYVRGRSVYVCKAGFRGEVHPGYLLNGSCRIVVHGRGY